MIATINKVVNGVIILSVVFGLLFWAYSAKIFERDLQSGGAASLVYWGLEDESVMQPVIERYQKDNPKVRVTYVKQSLVNYRTRLQTQLREGKGPDIFEIHNSWFPMLPGDLSTVPSTLLSRDEFARTYYPVAGASLTAGDNIYALPLEIDGLALYYNEEILRGANVAVPVNWAQFRDAARQVTVKNQDGFVVTAGAAMGTSNNVDYWPEIISLLFYQQPDGTLTNPDNDAGKEAVRFYTSFTAESSTKTWDSTLPTSTKMFTDGNLAFYFAPARQAAVIKQINPNLPFKTAPVPQLPGKEVSIATFWAQAVSSRSPSQKEAWRFVKYLSSPESLEMIYKEQVASRGVGSPFSRVDMAQKLAKDPVLGAYITQGNYYKSWYLNSTTADAGINEEMITLYRKLVDEAAISRGYSTATAPEIQLVLNKYFPPAVPVQK